MIEKIVLEDLSKSKGFHFLKNLNFFKKTKEIKFTDGVNILFAPNGAGKSSLLKMLAYSLACEQGGISKVTDQWRFDIMSGLISSDQKGTILDGINIFHDGKPAVYADARKKVGLNVKMELDDDFQKEGLDELLEKRSDGFKTINRTKRVFQYLDDFKSLPKEMEYKCNKDKLPECFKAVLEGKIPKDKPTILMDEPESGLSAIFQGNFFSNLGEQKNFNKFQWIIATHSPFVLLLPNVNVISLVDDDDYLENTLNAYRILFEQIDKK